MAFFIYQAFSKDGKKITGKIEAVTIQNVREELYSKGLYPVSVILESSENSKNNIFGNFFEQKMPLKDKIFFTKQLSLLLKSGIALAESLNLMIDQSPKYMRPMITKMRDDLKEGTPFATILSNYSNNFPPLYIQLVKAGEASGQMEKVLLRLAAFLDEEDKFNKAVSGAMRGPLIQLALIFVVAIGLLTLIVPRIATVFSSMGGELPSITKGVLALSDALLNNYIMIGSILLTIILLYISWANSKSGKLLIDTVKLKIPIVKYITRVEAVVQFSQTLGLLIESGVNITEALDIVVQIVNNQVLIEALKKARDNIVKQGKVKEYLQKTNLFSAVDIHLIGTGEQTGALDVMLNQVGNYNQDDLQEFASSLTALLNPISMVILAGVVGTIIFAIMAPLMNMSSMMG